MISHLIKLLACLLLIMPFRLMANSAIQQGFDLLKPNPAGALEIIQPLDVKSLSVLEQLQYAHLFVSSNNLQGHYPASIHFIETTTLPTPNNAEEFRQMLNLAIRMAWPYEATGQFDAALNWYKTAEDIALRLQDKEEQGYVKLQYSAVYMQQGYSWQALSIAKEAQQLLMHSKDEVIIADLNSQLGILYYLNGDFAESIALQNKVLVQAEKDHSVQERSAAHYNIANAYLKWGKESNKGLKLLKANQHYKQALELAIELNSNYLIRNNLLGLVALHTYSNNLSVAGEYVKQLLNLDVENQGFSALSFNLILAQYYARTKQTEAVQPHLDVVIEYFEKHDKRLPSYAIIKQKELAELYANLGDYQLAYVWLERYNNQVLSTQQLNLQQQVATLKSELDNQRLLHENSLLSLQSHRSGIITFIALLIVCITAAMLYWQYRKKRLFYKLSNTDFLTGIANRRFIMEEGERLYKRQQLSSIVLDIDHFKSINDQFGHDTGDLVLSDVTSIMQQFLSHGEMLGRIGGEEFLILLPNISQQELQEYAESLRVMIESHPFKTHLGQPLQVTASFGLAAYKAKSLATQFTSADQALYQAKQQGRNCWVLG
ncbi:tetratricopeptide repeat-containing diguanylate cyclase [Vibrio sp. LaRot3]|uniref:tetratricopeptide repeat-containing diguanylate cyclase n=1 Tax=Vibrio sp. LaRot3 TaxID=2998829 RepID=UPI0022CDBFCC|nr:tetratricopeptide repeat-containing diguanylate cyclase [Vibrio sp. LaRot3]MDA0148961.1 diguanylate cyclase [Vibrio sp. LaRot3]